MFFDITITKTVREKRIALTLKTDRSLVAIAGPSGSGKTTMLNCIAGLLAPDHGRISVDGTVLFDSDQGVAMRPDQRGCGYVFQDSRLFPHRDVRRNLTFGERRIGGSTAALTFSEIITLLDIKGLLHRKPASLSGGEIRRVAIGRALLSNPAFLLFDEPLSSLDAGRVVPILQAIEHLRDHTGLPIIYVSHNRAEIDRLTDIVIELDSQPSCATLGC